jgi:hypothetical protein
MGRGGHGRHHHHQTGVRRAGAKEQNVNSSADYTEKSVGTRINALGK